MGIKSIDARDKSEDEIVEIVVAEILAKQMTSKLTLAGKSSIADAAPASSSASASVVSTVPAVSVVSVAEHAPTSPAATKGFRGNVKPSTTSSSVLYSSRSDDPNMSAIEKKGKKPKEVKLVDKSSPTLNNVGDRESSASVLDRSSPILSNIHKGKKLKHVPLVGKSSDVIDKSSDVSDKKPGSGT